MRVTQEQLQAIFELASELHLTGKLTAFPLTTADASRTPVDEIEVTITSSSLISRWIIAANGDVDPVTGPNSSTHR